MRQLILVIIGFALFGQGCTKRETEISGQVFIVTTGGESKKLGDIPIALYEEAAITDFQSNMRAYLEKKRKEKEEAQPRLASIEYDLDRIPTAIKNETERRQELLKKQEQAKNWLLNNEWTETKYRFDGLNRLEDWHSRRIQTRVEDWQNCHCGTINEWDKRTETEYQQAKSNLFQIASRESAEREKNVHTVELEIEDSKQTVKNREQEIVLLEASKHEILANLEIPSDPSNYLVQLGKVFKTTRTDADGQFLFKVSEPKRYALVTFGQREVGRTSEVYYWLLWIEPNKGKYPKVLLSNSNMLSKDAPQCLLNLKTIVQGIDN